MIQINRIIIFYNNLCNKAFPIKTYTSRIRKSHQKPWLTKGVQRSLKNKNKLYKKLIKRAIPDNKPKYKQYRNKLHHLIGILKNYQEKFEQTQGNVKKTWNLINEIMNKNKSYESIKKR